MKTFLKILLAVVIIGGCLGAVGDWYLKRTASTAVNYRTVPIVHGDLLATISATGTLEPEEVVDVGAQVAGQILSFGPDPAKISRTIDYNTEVNKDDILAQIDDTLYLADVQQAQAAVDSAKAVLEATKATRASADAALESAKANVTKAQADLKQFEAKRDQAEKDWKRAKSTDKNVMSQADIDSYEAAYYAGIANVDSATASVALAKAGVNSANAAVNSANANIGSATAGVASAQAVLGRATKNLSYCTIKSPVKGVIIDRRVNIGQTVVSSLNAPSLFLIAKDLTKMQIWASVNEADIGHIEPGKPVTFNVDKLPGRDFHGVVGKVRMNAQTTQNVVTYTVEINVDNSDRALIPYLTANVRFQQDKHDDVLMVPNAALRWAPSQATQISPDARASAAAAGGGKGGSKASGDGGGPTTRRADGAPRQHGTLWLADGAFAKPVKVKTGITDGTNTEVSAPELKEGAQVIVGEARPDDTSGGDAKNPFMPQFGRRRGG